MTTDIITFFMILSITKLIKQESEGSAKLDEHNGDALKELSRLVERLRQQISLSRDKLAPLIKELRSLREKTQELVKVHAEKKTQYEVFIASRDAQTLQLEQEVCNLREEIRKDELRYNNLIAALDNLKLQESRLQEEMRGYITSTRNSSPMNGGDVTSITVKRHSYRLYKRKFTASCTDIAISEALFPMHTLALDVDVNDYWYILNVSQHLLAF
ncbi:hypothetical protein ACTXT7_005885 [Hymenolepis weldensis]